MRPGPTNSLVDVAGLAVGHRTRDEPGWLTGTTVVRLPDGGGVAGVDVRGAAPGTRETDLLDPRNLVDRVHALALSGGSALGLAAADGVAEELLRQGVGWPMGAPDEVVPIVPAAIVFDLGRGGVWRHHPVAEDGRAALLACTTEAVAQGCVGAGTGAKAGSLKGGIGSASVVLESGATVAALVVCNAAGDAVDPRTGRLWGAAQLLDEERAGLADAGLADGGLLDGGLLDGGLLDGGSDGEPAQPHRPGMATTIGVVATDVALTKAQAQKMAGIAHDGLARALKPVHTMVDGDTLFAVSTGARPTPELPDLVAVLEAGADCVTRAIVHAMLAATSVDRSADGGAVYPSYREARREA
ncbi:P1 family peptidase [Arsenicicoccus piscis]|uniref:Hydrolase n=1 Tax=Arsenicicoccus piscis TaxID=673954 RepID=A0ABQ6HQI5_9MICO|nr:P1 family peptidase [Arsenicicoccus piscis]MCH8627940.1 P1 family peptidase [Arsenicicoccus piscis]GMA20728.1 hydrolase [Arsenicicoccus piscis]